MSMLEMYWAMSRVNIFPICMLATFPKELKINLNSNLAILFVCDIGLFHD